MKNLFFPLMLLACLFVTACSDDEPLNPEYIKGRWVLLNSGSPEYLTIYNFTTTSFGNCGELKVYNQISDGRNEPNIPVKEYDWHAFGPQNNNGMLDISLVPVDATEAELLNVMEDYDIIDISDKVMIWKRIWPNDGKILRFIRRNDL